jgi:hypothetical protein
MKAVCPILLAIAVVSPAWGYQIGTEYEKWGSPIFGTPGGVVTWSIVPGGASVAGYPYISLDSFLAPGYEEGLRWAFAQWSAVANIQFREVPDNGEAFATTPDAGVIRLGGIDLGPGSGVLAQTAGPIGSFYESVNPFNSTTRFTSNYVWTYSDNSGGYNFNRVALHEIGHLLGLGHEPNVSSIMNYPYNEGLPLGLQPDDIAGIQFIYGSAVPEPSMFPVLLGLALCALGKSTKSARSRCWSGTRPSHSGKNR